MNPKQRIDIAQILNEQRFSGFLIGVIVFSMILMFLDGYDTQVIAFAAPRIAQAWHIPQSSFGTVFAMGPVGMLIGGIGFGFLADIKGRKPIIILSTLCFGLPIMAAPFCTTISQLVIMRLISGFGVGGLFSLAIVFALEFAPRRYRSTMVVIANVGYSTGISFGGVLAATVRHPLLDWYRKVCDFQHSQQKSAIDGLYHSEMTGAVKAYLGLAYDLYLCAHNAELPELLLKRLRNAQMFEGALYEAYVIGVLARAGFRIELEDESDSTRSHCELTATHQDTGRKFSVEVKAISSASSRAGATSAPPRIRGKLHEALCKQADHERVVFIELNRAELDMTGDIPAWVQQVDADLARAEQDLTVEGQPAPPAYVFVTNRGFMHALDRERWTEIGVSCSFKIDDLPSRPRNLQRWLRRSRSRPWSLSRRASPRHSARPPKLTLSKLQHSTRSPGCPPGFLRKAER